MSYELRGMEKEFVMFAQANIRLLQSSGSSLS